MQDLLKVGLSVSISICADCHEFLCAGEFAQPHPRRGDSHYQTGPAPRQSDFLAPMSMFGSFGDLSFSGFGGMRSTIDHSDFFRR